MVLLRWWLLFCGSLTGLWMCWRFGLLQALQRTDPTYIGFGCIGIYFLASIYLGWAIWRHDRRGMPMLWLVTNGLVELGLLGTLIGFLLMLSGMSLGTLNIANVAETQRALTAMSMGMYTAMTTTVAGLVTHMLLKLQLTDFEQ